MKRFLLWVLYAFCTLLITSTTISGLGVEYRNSVIDF